MRLPRLAMETTFSPLAFAQRAFCAAAIRARPAAESFLRDVFLSVPLSVAIALVRRSSCDVRRLCSCRSCARTTLRLDMKGIVTLWRAELLQQTGNAPKCRATNREFRGTELPARWKNTTREDLADFEVACHERLLGENRSDERPKFPLSGTFSSVGTELPCCRLIHWLTQHTLGDQSASLS